MGNRAVVTVEGSKVGVYLHWNGGPESVTAFLRAAKALKVRDPLDDSSYFYARFVQIVANFFGGTTSVGLDALDTLDTDNGDNGVYTVGKGFEITKSDSKAPVDAQKESAIFDAVMEANKPVFERVEA